MNTSRFFATLVLPTVLAWAGAAHANLVQLVTVNTSTLSGAGYAIAFSFQDGSAPADNNNTATLSNFNFGGGSAADSPVLLGGASGSLGTGVVLADSDFSSLFAEGFTPGSSLSFKLDLTTNLDASGTPDFFGFSILFNGTPLPTLDDLGGDNLLYVNVDSATPAAAVFATAPGGQVALDAPGLSVPPPPGPGPGQLPEPGSLPLLLAGLAGLFGVVRRGSRVAAG